MEKYLLFILFVIFFKFYCVSCSEGDRSPYYQNCVSNCMKVNCTQDGGFTDDSAMLQDKWSRLLLWRCKDECRYHCMWQTVQGFQERGYRIPKFHGKWPFIRVLGVQEPASVFASLLNLAFHVYMLSEIVIQFSVKSTPAVLLWHVFSGVCIHAWVWSTIFHTRDTFFTEFMDYACALSMVMALFVAAIIRVFHRMRKLTALVLLATLLYYVEHVRYLYSGTIDYSYNMLVNVVIGVVGSLIWLCWSWWQMAAGRRHAWRALVFVVLSGAALSLEVFDFPPKYYAWDAHALWHLSTAPLSLLFYRFVIDDLKYLQQSQLKLK